ncbi:MAG: lipoyl synthase [Candidatus Scalindua sp. AMX11]|nr:MAG: lipoyl synthase [Candidatus Scalindua sp.]NOG85118.1 lipoyl synthase [Planctomycetota bacterium]RZV69299.1 MAG: lipoyl synthase [Candidatus Scalindua sp. SCAELEC01]TDE66789.1 MAG: lipoyl synthase [Candidatus Scalindua sp. AMX11]GJQ60404.1 MAG: lipoyl synthase [Candidatus Scalindua sp.]
MRSRNLPDWLKVRIPSGDNYRHIRSLLHTNKVKSVCEEARCPNIAECYGRGVATFLILGDVCSRRCRYCNIPTGTPRGLDIDEPQKIAEIVQALHLNYVVITSVTRDDLPDLGGGQFYRTVVEIRKRIPECKIEILTPDFQGETSVLKSVLKSSPYIFNHNIEVVQKLFPQARSNGSYERSLRVLQQAKRWTPIIKSGLMVGLGETEGQILETIHDLRSVGVSVLTIGQYLQPRRDLSEVKKFYTHEEFERIKFEALNMGFSHVFSGPLVRSSYHAGDMVRHNLNQV